MKKLVKGVLKAVWRWSRPVRQPVQRKFETYLARCLVSTERVMTDETIVFMNHVVRELIRLQRQVEALQLAIEELADSREAPAVVGSIAPGDELRRDALKTG